MLYCIDQDSNYYESIDGKRHPDDIEVTQRPSPDHVRQVGEWVLPPKTSAQIQRELTDAVQNHLDNEARKLGYDDIKSAVTYADEPAVAKFQAEGQAFRAWRSLVWAYCYQALADVIDGKRAVPTTEALIAELPALVLPE